MPKASDITPDKNVSMLFKSGPGEGKTIAACSLAEFGPVYLAYFDKKVPVELFTFYTKIGRKDILENITYESFGSANVHEFLNTLYKFATDFRYIGVIVDSVTQLTSSAVNWSLGFDGKRDPKKIETPDWDEYKVETSLVTQALDICKTLNGFNIWTCHPLPKMEFSGSGKNITITKSNSIVTYGAKVGAMIPGNFTEIYHFGRDIVFSEAGMQNERVCITSAIGDDYAKTAFNLPEKINIQNKLFFVEWKRLVAESMGGVIL